MPLLAAKNKENYLLAAALAPDLIPCVQDASASGAVKPTLERMHDSIEGMSGLFAALDTIPAQRLEISEATVELKLATLGMLFKFHNYADVVQFLRENQELSLALFSIHQSLKHFFDGPFSLELMEPDEESPQPKLALWVHTDLSSREAGLTMKKYRDAWWHSNVRPLFKHITVTCAFS